MPGDDTFGTICDPFHKIVPNKLLQALPTPSQHSHLSHDLSYFMRPQPCQSVKSLPTTVTISLSMDQKRHEKRGWRKPGWRRLPMVCKKTNIPPNCVGGRGVEVEGFLDKHAHASSHLT